MEESKITKICFTRDKNEKRRTTKQPEKEISARRSSKIRKWSSRIHIDPNELLSAWLWAQNLYHVNCVADSYLHLCRKFSNNIGIWNPKGKRWNLYRLCFWTIFILLTYNLKYQALPISKHGMGMEKSHWKLTHSCILHWLFHLKNHKNVFFFFKQKSNCE